MAELIDERVEEETPLVDGQPVEEITEPEAEAAPAETPAEEPAEDIPEKYQGKTQQDLVHMLQEAERFNGRQSSEVGELRKSLDQLIQAQLVTQAPQEAAAEEEIDFFTDPDKAVARMIEQHPDVQEAKQAKAGLKEQEAQVALRNAHPDMDNILQDEGFAKWISASNVRTKMLQDAHTQYDHEKASELFSLWKERQGVVEQTAKVEEQARKQAVKQAATGNTRASGETPAKKVYRRADIIKLMKTDPERYQSMADEILAAYAQGRVKG